MLLRSPSHGVLSCLEPRPLADEAVAHRPPPPKQPLKIRGLHTGLVRALDGSWSSLCWVTGQSQQGSRGQHCAQPCWTSGLLGAHLNSVLPQLTEHLSQAAEVLCLPGRLSTSQNRPFFSSLSTASGVLGWAGLQDADVGTEPRPPPWDARTNGDGQWS